MTMQERLRVLIRAVLIIKSHCVLSYTKKEEPYPEWNEKKIPQMEHTTKPSMP